MDLGLEGKRALVTGASQGIGLAVVRMLASEGADVAFCARRQEILEDIARDTHRETGRTLVPIAADLSDNRNVEDFVSRASEALGGIDLLVNNVGASVFGPLEEVPDERWLHDIERKLMSYVRASRAALPHLRRAGGGRIIHIAGHAGRQPLPYHLPGGASNAAILNFTVALAQQVAGDRIHVLACSPGPVQTARFRNHIAANARAEGISEQEAEAQYAAELPLGYVPSAEEVAGVIVFLASPRAAYMTGTTVTVDGGLTRGI